MNLRPTHAALFLAASMNAACGEETSSPPALTIIMIRLADVNAGDAMLIDEPRVACIPTGSEMRLAPRILVAEGGRLYDGPVEIHDASCRADDCVVRVVEGVWGPEIAVSSAVAGRVEVDARIVAGHVSELAHAPVEFSDEPCKTGDR